MAMLFTIWGAASCAVAIMRAITYLDEPKRRVRK